ncbi:MAG: hypothetical protein KC492_20025 [Myxococcales bacterium]|nr:hypothetical protein [Myxococcales bacterium]
MLWHVDDLLARARDEGRRALFLLVARVSRKPQLPNVERQLAWIRRELRGSGARIVDEYSEGATWGQDLDHRPTLRRDVRHARRLQREQPRALVALVFVDRTRVLRSSHDFNEGGDNRLSVEDLAAIERFARGVPFATVVHPDATREELARTRQRYSDVAEQRSGRPKKAKPGATKRRREQLRPVVRALREEGLSWRAIEEATGVRHSTAWTWCR